MDAGGLYKLGTMTNSEQNVIFVYIYLDGGLRVGWWAEGWLVLYFYKNSSFLCYPIRCITFNSNPLK